MKVYVRSGDITGADIFVIAAYPDGTNVPEDAHLGYTVMYVPDDAIETRQLPGQPPAMYLRQNWRESASAYLRRRSDPSHQCGVQRSGSACRARRDAEQHDDLWDQRCGMAAEARARKATFDSGWNYITSVKQTADAMKTNLPANPSADSNWPIPPEKIVV